MLNGMSGCCFIEYRVHDGVDVVLCRGVGCLSTILRRKWIRQSDLPSLDAGVHIGGRLGNLWPGNVVLFSRSEYSRVGRAGPLARAGKRTEFH